MLFTEKFIKTLIAMSFTILLLVNIVFAFDLFQTFPVDTGVVNPSGFYSDKYFGVSTLIRSYKQFFDNNTYINFFQDLLADIKSVQKYFDISRVLQNLDILKVETVSRGSVWDTLTSIFTVLTQLFNILINFPYMLFAFIYLFFYAVYVISLVYMGILYACALLGGQFYSTFPSVDYPTYTLVTQLCLL